MPNIRNRHIKVALGEERGRRALPLKYPEIPKDVNDKILLTQAGDRLDTLAFALYGDERYWWIIANANPGIIRRDSYALDPGIQIRVPVNPRGIFEIFINEQSKN